MRRPLYTATAQGRGVTLQRARLVRFGGVAALLVKVARWHVHGWSWSTLGCHNLPLGTVLHKVSPREVVRMSSMNRAALRTMVLVLFKVIIATHRSSEYVSV